MVELSHTVLVTQRPDSHGNHTLDWTGLDNRDDGLLRVNLNPSHDNHALDWTGLDSRDDGLLRVNLNPSHGNHALDWTGQQGRRTVEG